MKYKSRDYLLALEQAQDAKIIELERTCTALRIERDQAQFDARNLQHQLSALQRAQHVATQDEAAITFNALTTRCKRLNAIGVPAVIHRGHVLHSRTRAVINPGQYGVGT